MTVTWSGVTNPTTHDWIGLYHPGDANTAFSVWAWDSSCTQVAGNVAQELRLLRVHDVGTRRHLRVQALQQRQLHPACDLEHGHRHEHGAPASVPAPPASAGEAR